MSDKLPPHSDEAERGALGCLLLAPDRAKPMLSKLQTTDFFDSRHRELFTACFCLTVDGKPLDLLLLCQMLKDKGKLDEAGGLSYLTALPDASPSASNFPYYLDILKEKAERRQVIATASALNELALDESIAPAAFQQRTTDLTAAVGRNRIGQREWFRFFKPTECRDYQPPTGMVLVGDYHVVRGSVTLIGGPPGIGKSRAALALAVAGKTCEDWLGRKIHRAFKTAILQNENGRLRLKQDFANCTGEWDDFIRISGTPPFGMALDNHEFRAQLTDWLAQWLPDLVVLDPWNSAARDDGQRDYLAVFEALTEILPKGDDTPALVINAHTRKPKVEERSTGRNLLNEIAGSHVLGSRARTAFVMLHATDSVTEDRIVWTCVKNNDGPLGDRSVWHRRNGVFEPCPNFEWDAFDNPAQAARHSITKDHLDRIFENGHKELALKDAVEQLRKLFGFGKSASYGALDTEGRFRDHLSEKQGLLAWNP